MKEIRFWRNWKPFAKRGGNSLADPAPFRLALTYYSSSGNAMNMALACLSAYVKREIPGIEVRLFPIIHDQGKPIQAEYSIEGFTRSLMEFCPNLVAASCMSNHWEPMQPFFAAMRSLLPATPLIVGGYQAILSPEETIAAGAVDYICVGDGEVPLVTLIHKLMGMTEGTVPGLWEKLGAGGVAKSLPVLTEDLMTLPFPDYTIYEDENGNLGSLVVSVGSKKGLPVMSGRGCPYRCTYCCNTVMLDYFKGQGSYLRKYDPERLVKEFARLRDRYGVDYFEFWDELFLFNMRYVHRLLKLYGEQVGLPFSINSRVESMDEDFCKAARDAGCHTIWFGLESGSETYRNRYLGRKMSNEQILAAAENARKAGINRLTFNIVGMPFETRADMLATLRINETIKPEVFAVFIYMPLRGTPLYELAEREGLLLPDVDNDFLIGHEKPRLKLKEHPGGATNEELNEVITLMLEFNQKNCREDQRDLPYLH